MRLSTEKALIDRGWYAYRGYWFPPHRLRPAHGAVIGLTLKEAIAWSLEHESGAGDA